MNSNPTKNANDWLPCETGAIGDAAASIRTREQQKSRRQFLRAAATASVVVAGAGFAGWSLMGQGRDRLINNPNFPGGIACSKVKLLLDDYIDNSLNDVALTESIKVHLGECPHCRGIHDSMVETA